MAQQPAAIDLSDIPDAPQQGKDGIDLSDIPDAKPAAKVPYRDPRGIFAQRAGEFVMGGVREAERRVVHLAAPLRRALGSWAGPGGEEPPEPTTTAGRLGAATEQISEFFIPEAVAGKLVKGAGLARTGARAALTAAGTYGVATAQGDPHPGRAGATAGVLGMAPAALPAAYKALRTGAKASLARVLGAGETAAPEFTRAVQKVVPTALDEGIRPTWTGWLKQARLNKAKAGLDLEQHLAGLAGSQPVPVQPVIDALDELANKAARSTLNAATTASGGAAAQGQQLVTGTPVYNQRLLKQIDTLKSTLRQHGGAVPARVLHDLKQSWQEYVYKAGDFANRSKIRVAYEARAKETAARAVRAVLDQDAPSIAEMDRMYHLHAQLYSVLRKAAGLEEIGETGARVTSRVSSAAARAATGLTIGAGSGATLGYESTHSVKGAVVGALVGAPTARMLGLAFRSPAWRALPAATKQRLATAITNGDAEATRRVLAPLLSATAATRKDDQ